MPADQGRYRGTRKPANGPGARPANSKLSLQRIISIPIILSPLRGVYEDIGQFSVLGSLVGAGMAGMVLPPA